MPTDRLVELKPCPFCGGEAEIEPKNWAGRDYIGVFCKECLIFQDSRSRTAAEAIEVWNTRATTQPPDHTDLIARRMGAEFVPHDFGQAGALAKALVDAVREVSAQVCDQHIDIKLCRELFGEGRGGAFAMASHLAADVRGKVFDDHPRIAAAIEAIAAWNTRPAETTIAELVAALGRAHVQFQAIGVSYGAGANAAHLMHMAACGEHDTQTALTKVRSAP